MPIDPRISAIAAGIAAAIPEAQVRLFGSRARRLLPIKPVLSERIAVECY
jgi:hypothetical protein